MFGGSLIALFLSSFLVCDRAFAQQVPLREETGTTPGLPSIDESKSPRGSRKLHGRFLQVTGMSACLRMLLLPGFSHYREVLLTVDSRLPS